MKNIKLTILIALSIVQMVCAQYTYDGLEGITGQVLKPIKGKKGDAAALIFLIGDKCDHEAYVDQLKLI
jgi:hypothetical protein